METSESLSPAVVITGASSGIGREIARIAAREGYALLLLGRSESALDELEAELKTQGTVVSALSVYLEDRHAIKKIDQALAARNLYCDILVNSAGFGAFGPIAKVDAQQ